MRGASKTFANAEALFVEATLLANSGAWARALLLHQISLEECAKIEMICAATSALLTGHSVDLKLLKRAFAKHESKNKTNAYFLPPTAIENEARTEGDVAKAVAAFEDLQEAFHKDSNYDKNASLYVDFGDTFTSPLELITEEVFLKVRERNEEFMSGCLLKTTMLARWEKDLDAAVAELEELDEVFGLTTLDRSKPEELTVLHRTLNERLQEFARRRLAKKSLPSE